MSVVARQDIAQGQFVAQYAGEMLTNLKADKRLADYDNKTGFGHALLVLSAHASATFWQTEGKI